ncbi:DUF922 domain-containing protein [Zhouia amylolytica]|uniref:DUF922 domain-containing protein n=1 Tax=Zhouia amylolytica AD3 TaxID=1286632 RepID=W2UST2_9FLAO|nr:hypothetical protein [Zhouia amylolytica]ETN97029.1 hypothetical protein P278_04550 [Zhouia amylolytica AD3]
MKLLFFILFLLFASVQDAPKEIILWEAGQKLSWADFKGRPVVDSRAVAVTSSGIGYKLITRKESDDRKYDVVVFAYFSTRDSWYKSRYVNNAILAHEQLHFDITALYAQKLIHEISELNFEGDVGEGLETLYHHVTKEMDSVQKIYDKQTEASVNESAQVIWRQKINDQLTAYLKLNEVRK